MNYESLKPSFCSGSFSLVITRLNCNTVTLEIQKTSDSVFKIVRNLLHSCFRHERSTEIVLVLIPL